MQTIIGTTFRNTKVTLHRFYDQSVGYNVHAVYHQDYRHCYLQEYPTSLYAHGRASGNMDDDGCCYYQPHHNWSKDRSNWPAVLFQYQPDISVRGRSKLKYLVTPEGWLVLDLNSKPVKDFRMPFTLSSKPEPYLVEAILRENYDKDMQVQDIRARMPGVLMNGVDKIRTGTISMSINRFRMSAGLISWSAKIGSEAMKDYLDILLPPECLAANCTRSFRNLYPHEVEEMKLINAGRFPNKARPGNKNFSEENKRKVFEKAAQKFRQKRRAFDKSTEFTSTYYKVQQIRAQREGRSYSGSIENDSQASDEESYYDEEEYENEEEDDEELVAIDMDPGAAESENEEDDEEMVDLDMNADADYQAPVTPIPEEQVIDFRELRPTSYLQIDLISLMLEPSRLQFFYMTGASPPDRVSSESYLTQYNSLLSALNEYTASEGEEEYDGTLIGLTEFTDKKWTWNRPWCLKAFGTEPHQDHVSLKLLEIKQEMAAREISPEIKVAEERGPEPMVAGEMAVEDIKSMDFSLPPTDYEGMNLETWETK